MTRAALLAPALLALLLAACSAPPPTGEEQPSRYSQANDGAPPRSIDPGDVADAIPRADPILAAGNKSPYTINGVTYEVLESARNYEEEGIASWYGTKFQGHKTSNGEIYDLYQASAAHKTLPIPCYALETNLDNGRKVVVRINDRGPVHADRLIDLRDAAAVKLGYRDKGTARVKVQVLNIAGVDDRRGSPGSHYRYLQLGAFGSQASATRLQGDLEPLLDVPVVVSEVESGGQLLYRVRVGPVASSEELVALQRQLERSGFDSGQPLP